MNITSDEAHRLVRKAGDLATWIAEVTAQGVSLVNPVETGMAPVVDV